MSLLSILLISISGKAIMILCVLFLMVIILWSNLKKDEVRYEEMYPEQFDNNSNNTSIYFNLKNNTDEELILDLLNLNEEDDRYSFNNGDKDSIKLKEYLKSNTMFVNTTRVIYGINEQWYKNFIYHTSYTPIKENKEPILIAFDDFDKYQFQSNIIQSEVSYPLGNFDSLEIKLIPKDTMSIVLFCSDYNKCIKKQPVVCALSIKNTSNEKKTVELFNEDYLNKSNEDKSVEIKSIFGDGHYEQIIKCNEMPLVVKDIKFIISKENIDSSCKINNKEFKIFNYITANQVQANVIDVPLENKTYIFNMSVEIEPNTEILISIK